MVEIVDKLIFEKTITESFTDGERFNFNVTIPGGAVLSGSDIIYVDRMFAFFSMDSIRIMAPGQSSVTDYTLSLSDIAIDFGTNFTLPITTIGGFPTDSQPITKFEDPRFGSINADSSSTVDNYLGDGTSVGDLTISGRSGSNKVVISPDQDIDFTLKIAMLGRKP